MIIQILIIDQSGKNKYIEIESTEPLETLKILIEAELGIPFIKQQLYFQNKSLNEDNKQLQTYGINNNDMIQVQQVQQLTNNNKKINVRGALNQISQIQQNYDPLLIQAQHEAQQVKQFYETNPDQLNFILHQKPELAHNILSDDPNNLVQFIYQKKKEDYQKRIQEMKRIAELNNDPFSLEAQKQIEEEIKNKNIDENLAFAQEYLPESFGHITMLYIEVKINKQPIQAFVDSGAQSTIMSLGCAKRLGIDRLIDKRFQGTALGIGTSKIIGRIHAVDMNVMNKIMTCTLTILEDDKVDFLFGLDQLRRHQCSIDLKKNVLRIDSCDIEIPFLSEREIKKSITDSFYKGDENKQQQNLSQISQKDIKEEQINQLINLGFPRNKVIQALEISGWNAEVAASLLYSNQI